MNRRHALTSLLAAACIAPGPVQAGTRHRPLRPLWERWKAAHLERNGRVVDRLQSRASHSEGQGYGMILAALLRDAAAFEAMHDWTQRHLALRPDPLLAWRWLPDSLPHVPDRNNATDGDLFHAWALQKGAEAFGRPELSAMSAEISAALLEACVFERPDRPGERLLLPAVHGFESGQTVVYNPSYAMPLAMRALAAAHGHSDWIGCARASVAITRELAAQGPMPDWIGISPDGLAPAPGFEDWSGYEAIRVPLFLIWSGHSGERAVAVFAEAALRGRTPAQGGNADGRAADFPVVLRRSGGTVVERSPDPGYGAIAALARCAVTGDVGAAMPPFTADQPYFPATLQLMTLVAQREVLPRCMPL